VDELKNIIIHKLNQNDVAVHVYQKIFFTYYEFTKFNTI